MAVDFPAELKKNRIIPVAQFGEAEPAFNTAELLIKHSIHILEVTLRTEGAADIIMRLRKKFPDLMVGAGSVLSLEALKRAIDSGASFCVAPGTDTELIDYSLSKKIPFIPGVATPTELNAALKKCEVIKVFPISLLGGVEYIKAITAPFKLKSLYLIPTGGVNQDNYREYLKQDRVAAVGMSYIVDSALIQKGDFAALEERMIKVISGLTSL